MSTTSPRRACIEPLESRIAPASVLTANWKTATLGAPIELFAGDGLSTAGANSGTYLLYVEKGSALVFITDLNLNGEVEYNEITGIAAGDGLRLTSFVDIHGDITTNLVQVSASFSGVQTTRLLLTDSDNNRLNDVRQLGDGRVLANSSIEAITLRSLRFTDITDQNGDGAIDETDVAVRKAYTTYSIFGDIIAGRGFGAEDGGLLIDTTNESGLAENFGFAVPPTIGSIRVGSAGSGQFFSYGVSRGDDFNGTFVKFTAPQGQVGGGINGVRAISDANDVPFNLTGLYAGQGGFGANGGNIRNVTLAGDDAGGYEIIAGDGGRGSVGGVGGSIINFSDRGSQTSRVLIQSGTGGVGTTSAGGNAGDLSIGTFNVYGNVSIDLGSGGDGFTAGGNGAALSRGVFNQPTPTPFTPGNVVGTWRDVIERRPLGPNGDIQDVYRPSNGNIGSTQGIDFDGDGFGDIVYTSKVNSGLVVQFGDGTGGARRAQLPDGSTVPDRLYLAAARNGEALTVGDFNGDGLPDIATASGDQGSQAGIIVFLNRGKEDINNNGVIDSGEDINANGQLDFIGFAPGRFSPIPGLDNGDPTTDSNFDLGAWLSPTEVSSLVAGDFDGNGKVEIAAVITRYGLKGTDDLSGVTTSLSNPFQTVIFLTPDVERNNATDRDEFTGQFFMDFGTRAQVVNGNPEPAQPRLPIFDVRTGILAGDLNNFTSVVIQSTALTGTATNDVLFIGARGQTNHRFVDVVEYRNRDPLSVGVSREPVSLGTYDFGFVDTNRDTGADRISLQRFELRDFTIFDPDNNGIADIAVLSSGQDLYLVGVRGNGTGSGSPDSGTGDNTGNFFGDRGQDLNVSQLMAVRAVNADGDGLFDDLTMLTDRGDWARVEYRPGPMPTGGTGATGVRSLGPVITGTITVGDAGSEFFADVMVPDLSRPDVMSAVTVDFNSGNNGGNPRVFLDTLDPASGNGSDFVPLSERGLRLRAGDGGDSLVGKGGTGGLIGSGATRVQTVDPISLLTVTTLNGSVQINASGSIVLEAGNGGNGFTTGGKGGSISGVVTRALPTLGLSTSAVAGDGGRAVSGSGGAGGDLTQNSFFGGFSLLAGDGGDGRAGGAGGNVVGNGTRDYDSSTASLLVTAGNGGNGIRSGGNGGGISGFSPTVGDPGSFAEFTLAYRGGNGGTAVAGPGGRGGSIANSSPREGDAIQGEILIDAGDGGDGITGGDGGSVTNFVIKPATSSRRPGVFSILSGSGGDGLAGNGGTGGGISSITIPARGTVTDFGSITGYSFSRIIAGAGGDSASARGGTGGGIADVRGTGATEGSIAMVAGAGGDGLFVGGNGGNVLRTELFLPASSFSKALIVAGEGGDARGFVPNANDSAPNQAQNAFGGRIGVGGLGGSITDFAQRGNIGSHFDLIAGNGGNTSNYGSLRDTRSYVGNGGSIQRVRVSGDIGNVDPDNPATIGVNENLPIKSYNNSLAGETMADWVQQHLRADVPTSLMAGGLTDAVGNVGLVAGAAGLNKAVVTNLARPDLYVALPAPNSVNGSVVDLEARNLMSAVAGSVDKIARIQIVRNLRVLGGIIGSDKGVIGQNDYLDEFGAPLPDGKPVLDGRLVDGAVVTRAVVDVNGVPVTLPGRVYTPS